MKCCMCGKEIEGRDSNNALPVKKGRCCDMCNRTVIIPARIAPIISKNKFKTVNEMVGDRE